MIVGNLSHETVHSNITKSLSTKMGKNYIHAWCAPGYSEHQKASETIYEEFILMEMPIYARSVKLDFHKRLLWRHTQKKYMKTLWIIIVECAIMLLVSQKV